MGNNVGYVQAEVVPAHTELVSILKNTNGHKVVFKCDVQGSEFKILNDLDQHDLLRSIDVIVLETHRYSPERLITTLKKNNFDVDDMLRHEENNIHRILAYKRR
jgi:hypothetical protein